MLYKPNFFDKFSAVVVSMGLQLNEVFVVQLSEALYRLGIPLVAVDTCGFMGYFRLSYPEHPVIETHPESFNDLRLEAPIPGLEAWVEAIDFDSGDEQHGNIPYAAILLHFIKRWAQNRDAPFPTTYQQKLELKKLIASGMLTLDEENFEEAIAAVNGMVQVRKVPNQVLAIFQNPKCQNIDEKSTEFWLLARALYEFYRNEGMSKYLPISGAIPDMKADTVRYVELQKLYKEQAARDIQAVEAHLKALGVEAVHHITPHQVATFCKNAYYLHLTESVPLHLEWSKVQSAKLDMDQLCAEKHQLWLWLAFRARHRVAITANKLLGQGARSNLERDGAHLLSSIEELLTQYSLDSAYLPTMEFVTQFLTAARQGELATTASVLGGLVAQELTKLFTKQYVPLPSTCIFDGLAVGAIPIDLQLKPC